MAVIELSIKSAIAVFNVYPTPVNDSIVADGAGAKISKLFGKLNTQYIFIKRVYN